MTRFTYQHTLLLLFLCVFTAFSLQSANWAAEQNEDVTLTILHTNDIHGHLFPMEYDAYGTPSDDIGGAARRATLIRNLKKSSKNPVLVMDAGDLFTRGPIADLLGEPDIEIMNLIPCDVMTLGNNEFKAVPGMKGQEIMFERIRQAKFPILSANVFRKSTGETIVPPYTVFDVDGVRVGVFGLTAPRTADYPEAEALQISDPIKAARKILPELRKKSDFVIALTHLGYVTDLMLAMQVSDIDVIVGGDSHTWLDFPTVIPKISSGTSGIHVNRTIITHAGEWGVRVGELNLRLRRDADGTYKVADYSSRLHDVDQSHEPAPDVEAVVERYSRPFQKTVGSIDKTISRKEALGWMAESMRLAAGTEVGAVWRSNVENGLKAGPVTELDIRKMLPFSNRLVVCRITGKHLKEIIEEHKPGLSGARIDEQGRLLIGDDIAEDSRHYRLVIDEYFPVEAKSLASLPSIKLKLTVRDAAQRRLAPITDAVVGAPVR